MKMHIPLSSSFNVCENSHRWIGHLIHRKPSLSFCLWAQESLFKSLEIISTEELSANLNKKKINNKKKLNIKGCLHSKCASLRFLWKNQSMQPGATNTYGKQLHWSQDSQHHTADWCCNGTLTRLKSVPSQHDDAMLYRITDSELGETQKDHQGSTIKRMTHAGIEPNPDVVSTMLWPREIIGNGLQVFHRKPTIGAVPWCQTGTSLGTGTHQTPRQSCHPGRGMLACCAHSQAGRGVRSWRFPAMGSLGQGLTAPEGWNWALALHGRGGRYKSHKAFKGPSGSWRGEGKDLLQNDGEILHLRSLLPIFL